MKSLVRRMSLVKEHKEGGGRKDKLRKNAEKYSHVCIGGLRIR